MAQHAGSGMGAHNRKRNKSGGSRSAIYSHVKEDSQGGGLTTGRMDPRSSSLPASTHLVCGVSPQVTVWLLELRLAHLHSSQEEGKVRSRTAPAVHPPLGTFPRPHSGTSPGASRAPYLQLQLLQLFPSACFLGSHQAHPFPSITPHQTSAPHLLPSRGSWAPALTKARGWLIPHHPMNRETETQEKGLTQGPAESQ